MLGSQLLPKADIPVEKKKQFIQIMLDKNQLNLMRLVHAMRSNGPLPQVVMEVTTVAIFNYDFVMGSYDVL